MKTAAKAPIDPNVIVLLSFTLIVPFVLGSSFQIFGDGDVSWHIAAGRWMIAHHRVPFADPFSFTAAGKPWVAHEWLSEVLMGAAYNLAGFTGVALLLIVSLSVLMLLLWLELSRWLRSAFTAGLMFAVMATIIPFLTARPMALMWPMLAFWTMCLIRARARRRPPLWLVLVMLLWVNLHASFALGLLLIPFFALDALIVEDDKRAVIQSWGIFGLLCGAVCLINPNTTTVFLMPIGAFTSKNINLIQEFRPTDMSFTPWFEYALFLVLGMCLVPGAKVRPVMVLVVLGMLHLALQHMRHQVLFMIVAVLVLARPIGSTFTGRTEWGRERLPSPALGRLAVVGFLVLAAIRLAAPLSPQDSTVNPISAMAAIPSQLRGQPVLNSYSFGGPLILHGIRPFIDGRTDVYGEPFVLDYKKLLDGNQAMLRQLEQRWNLRWALIATSDKELLSMLDSSREWRRIRADRFAVTFVRS
jgi:hypothetical protein